MRIARRVLSPLVVLVALLLGGWALRWVTAGSWDALRDGNPGFDVLITFVACVLVWACFAWLVLSLLLITLSAIPGALGSACGAVAARMTPALYHRAARIALGLSVAAGPVAAGLPASAAPADHSSQVVATQSLPNLERPVTRGGMSIPDLDRPVTGPAWQGIPDLSRPVTGEQLPNPERPDSRDPITRAGDRGDRQTQEYVVKRGDTLWDIASTHLPDDADATQITQEWHRWYDANRDVIGGDPDLILPGQVFTPPGE